MAHLLDRLGQDMKTGLRKWAKHPGSTAFIIGTLAFGIGVNATIFSIVDSVLLRPLPYRTPERLVAVYTDLVAQDGRFARSSGPEILDMREQAPSLEALGGIWQRPAALTDEAHEPEEIEMGFVTAGFLSIFGVSPFLGRDIDVSEDVTGAQPVIVLSFGLWQRRYGGDPEIVGRTISMDGKPHMVVGVMPRGFTMLLPADAGISPSLEAWVAWGGGYREMNRAFRVFTVVGRIGPDTSLMQARTELEALARRLLVDEAEHYARSGLDLHLEPLHREVTATARPVVTLLGATAFLVLCIACANVANLLLLRATSMQSEVRLRSALGASRTRLMQQLVTEAVLLGIAGGVLGLILSSWSIDLLRWVRPGELPRFEQVTVGVRVGLFALIAAISSGGVVGLLSAFHVSRAQTSLSPQVRSSESKGRVRLRETLVVGELALSMALLVGAGLLVRTLHELSVVPLGFDTGRVTTVKLSLIDYTYPYSDPAKIARFYRGLFRGLEEDSRLEAVGASTELPLDGQVGFRLSPYSYEVDGEPVEWDTVTAHYATVTPGWFDALGIPLKTGRRFAWTDDLEHPPVVIVDEELARRAWPGESALGKRLQAYFRQQDGTARPLWAEVVGVVGHVRYHPSVFGGAQIYVPHQQSPQRTMAVAVRSPLPTENVAGLVRSGVASLEATQPVHSVRSMESYRRVSVAERRFAMWTVAFFAGTALALAVMGVYGVLAFVVRQRAREIGIRVALGATPSRILGAVMSRGVRLVILGTALGAVLSGLLTRSMASLVFGVSAYDPWTFLAVALVLMGVSLLACWLPGRRAASVDAIAALRES